MIVAWWPRRVAAGDTNNIRAQNPTPDGTVDVAIFRRLRRRRHSAPAVRRHVGQRRFRVACHDRAVANDRSGSRYDAAGSADRRSISLPAASSSPPSAEIREVAIAAYCPMATMLSAGPPWTAMPTSMAQIDRPWRSQLAAKSWWIAVWPANYEPTAHSNSRRRLLCRPTTVEHGIDGHFVWRGRRASATRSFLLIAGPAATVATAVSAALVARRPYRRGLAAEREWRGYQGAYRRSGRHLRQRRLHRQHRTPPAYRATRRSRCWPTAASSSPGRPAPMAATCSMPCFDARTIGVDIGGTAGNDVYTGSAFETP